MFGSLGFTELILILFIVLIIFGAGKLPQLGEGVGRAIRGFKKSVHEAEAVETDAHHADGQPDRPQNVSQASVAAPASDACQVVPPAAPAAQRGQDGVGSPTPVSGAGPAPSLKP